MQELINYSERAAAAGSMWWWLLALAPNAPEKIIVGRASTSPGSMTV